MNDNPSLKVQLKGLSGNYNNINYNIGQDEFLIGRHFDCDLVINEKTVSSQHAKIYKNEDHFEIEDLDSSNGTFVNNEKIKTKRLRTEDVIAFDKYKFRFINPEEVARTVISDGEDFRRSMKTEIRKKTTPPIKKKGNSDTNPIKIDDIHRKIINKSKSSERGKGKHGFFFGLFLSLITAFTINIGFILLIGMIKLKNIEFSAIWNSLKATLSGFPLLHFHTYWKLSNTFDILHILIGLCIPIGLILAGIVIQRTVGGSRFKNAFLFSLFYAIAGFFLQIASMNFNAEIWFTFNRSFGSGIIADPAGAFIFTIVYFLIVVFLFSFLGTLFSGKNRAS